MKIFIIKLYIFVLNHYIHTDVTSVQLHAICTKCLYFIFLIYFQWYIIGYAFLLVMILAKNVNLHLHLSLLECVSLLVYECSSSSRWNFICIPCTLFKRHMLVINLATWFSSALILFYITHHMNVLNLLKTLVEVFKSCCLFIH